jgi:epoxyqueuosine reductase QueG
MTANPAPPDARSSFEAYARDLGFSLFGVADIASLRDSFLLPESVRRRYPAAVALGKRLLEAVLEDILDRPTPLYFHHYRQINAFLDRGAFLFASRIQDLGFAALPIAASQIIDWQKQLGHVSHKAVGRLAGLGWIGRNNLLVHSDLGSRFRLVTVLTDMPLSFDSAMPFGCGSCRACVDACPAGAISEKPEDFDHRRCYEKLDEFRRQHLVSQHICGVCVKACRGRRRSGP